jgi:hypothetical protein
MANVKKDVEELADGVAKWTVEFENGVKVEVAAVSGSRAVAVARRALHDVAEKVAVATEA